MGLGPNLPIPSHGSILSYVGYPVGYPISFRPVVKGPYALIDILYLKLLF